MLIKSLLLVTCATAFVAADFLATRGRFIGDDTTKSGATPEQIFQDPVNHPTAVASILRGLAANDDFVPAIQPAEELYGQYDAWKSSIAHESAFVAGSELYRTVRVPQGDANALEPVLSRVLSLTAHGALAAEEIVKMLPTKIDAPGQWVATLVLIENKKDEGEEKDVVKVYLYQLTLQLEPESGEDVDCHLGNHVVIPQQKAQLFLKDYTLDDLVVEAMAEEYANAYGVTPLNDFEWYFDSSNAWEGGIKTLDGWFKKHQWTL